MWTVHQYSVDHVQQKPSFNMCTLMQWPLKWPCFLLIQWMWWYPTLQRGTPPFRDTWLFVAFVIHIICVCFFFFKYVSCFLVMYMLKSVWVSSLQLDPFFHVGTWLLPAASHVFGATGFGSLGQVQDIGRVKNIYLKTGYICRNCLNIYLSISI